MANKAETAKAELIERIAATAKARLDKARAGEVERFCRLFYGNVPPDDILGDSAENLYSAALALWNFGLARPAGAAKLRAYNPRLDEHGWRSSHSVIEIVNDDMPFLVDSVTAELNRRELTVHLVIHPILHVARDAKGQLTGSGDAKAPAESYMQIRISEQTDPATLQEICAGVGKALADVRVAVRDWKAMRAKMVEVAGQIKPVPGFAKEEIAELRDFLEWAVEDHFTFLGYRDYDFIERDGREQVAVHAGSGLGILSDDTTSVYDGLRNDPRLSPAARDYARRPRLITVMKSNRRATVHRPIHMDTIGVTLFDAKGKPIGERLFVGLFTSVAYNTSPRDIPLLRRKMEKLVARSGFAAASHDGKALVHILETYPRDELFQASEEELFDTALGVLHLQERQRIAIFVRRDPFERFVSCLIYVPRDRFSTELRLRMQEIVAAAFQGRISAFYTQMTDAALGRLHLIVQTEPGKLPEVDIAALEERLVEAGRSWTDRLQSALVEAKGEAQGLALLRRYARAFPASFRENFAAHAALFDIERLEEAIAENRLTLNLYRPIEAQADELHFKIYNTGAQIPLSDVLPVLEDMGVKVISEILYPIEPAGLDRPAWLYDFAMTSADGSAIDIGKVKDKFHDAYARVWSGDAEDDGFNRLVLLAGLSWREVALLRAFSKYLRQAQASFSQAYMELTLGNHPAIAAKLVALFHTRFDPALKVDRAGAEAAIRGEIETALDSVANADEDRILRRFLNLIDCCLRTNYYQPSADGGVKSYISFKLDSRRVEELPLPRPMVEIWVYSPRAEAVHLRGGKVARGGIRWSDRREDFRTEILGLMKAQMVKNAVIVPVGSKGGFVVKRPPTGGGRDQLMAEVIECYKTLMRGMLDITDNLGPDGVIPPKSVLRLDEDDPYLVVAADKGTATFSDIANSVSQEYGFWLDDAFASGGSAGYDHKKMGITARGGWESVKRHFRETGVDVQAKDFTAVGVGDMAGDVFGNGLLQSPHTKLLAAFNHLHIFIDPSPDPAKSFAERKRLFDLPRSAWSDYDAKLISPGGGIFERKAKRIPLSAEMRQLLGLAGESATPNEIIRAILTASVDLLWLGGIGTYVKAAQESHADVGDRANDGLRVDAEQLRCKVVGEGANLGLTQLGRIAYAQKGGRINTDAVDNSAGVDCSDHEVNIKILLNGAVAAGDLTLKQRDKLLAEMTEEVGELVLRDNYLQTQALSIAQEQGWMRLDRQTRFMRWLERAGKLDRTIEFLPDDETLAQRGAQKQSLTRPESAVLLAYSKIALYDELLPSEFPDDPQLVEDLVRYFPAPLRQRFAEDIARHRLRREIIATVVTNSIVNRTGSTFIYAVKERTGLGASDVARAYIVTRGVFALRDIWAAIEALDNKAPAKLQTQMLQATVQLAESGTLWFLRNGRLPLAIAGEIEAYSPGIASLTAKLEALASEPDRKTIQRRREKLTGDGAPAELAARVAALDLLGPCLDIVRIARDSKADLDAVAKLYFAVGQRFHLDWLRSATGGVNLDTHWDRLAVAAVMDDLYGHQRDLTIRMLQSGSADPKAIEAWIAGRGPTLQRVEMLIADLRQLGGLDLAKLAVANRELRSLVGA